MNRSDWFEIWCEDWEGLITTQSLNIKAELDAGWKWKSDRVQHEVNVLNQFQNTYRLQLGRFAEMEEKQVQRWCYYDLLRRGAISR